MLLSERGPSNRYRERQNHKALLAYCSHRQRPQGHVAFRPKAQAQDFWVPPTYTKDNERWWIKNTHQRPNFRSAFALYRGRGHRGTTSSIRAFASIQYYRIEETSYPVSVRRCSQQFAHVDVRIGVTSYVSMRIAHCRVLFSDASGECPLASTAVYPDCCQPLPGPPGIATGSSRSA